MNPLSLVVRKRGKPNSHLWHHSLTRVVPEIVQKCPRREKRAFKVLGAVVLASAFCVSAAIGFATSTLTSNFFIITHIAIVFGVAFLVIDQLILACYRACTPWPQMLGVLAYRTSLSLCVGTIIAHLLTLFLFRATISAELAKSGEEDNLISRANVLYGMFDEGSLLALAVFFGIAAIYVVIDIMPLLVRHFSDTGEYDRNLHMEEFRKTKELYEMPSAPPAENRKRS